MERPLLFQLRQRQYGHVPKPVRKRKQLIPQLALALWLAPLCVFAKTPRPVEIHVYDAPAGHAHAEQVLAIVKKLDCASCKVIHHAIYTPEGELKSSLILQETEALLTQLEKLECKPHFIPILHFSVNLESSEKTVPVEARLSKLAACRAHVVAAVGENPENRHRMLKLENTVMGKVKGALLIGEQDAKGNLAPRSNYGAMFLTLAPPAGLSGSSFSAARFSALLAEALARGETPAQLKKRLQ